MESNVPPPAGLKLKSPAKIKGASPANLGRPIKDATQQLLPKDKDDQCFSRFGTKILTHKHMKQRYYYAWCKKATSIYNKDKRAWCSQISGNRISLKGIAA